MSFISDLKKQDKTMDTVSDYAGAKIIEGYCKEGDLLLEVKEDLGCIRTGNIAIEYAYKGEPSGVMAGSDMFVYKIGNCYWRIKTSKFIEWIENNKDKYRTVTGGDGNHSSLILLKLFYVTQVFDFWFKE